MRATGCGCGFWFWFWSVQQAALTEWLLLSVSAGALSSVFLRGPQYLLACCGGSSPPPVFSSECFLPHQRSLSEASAPLSAGAAALSCSPQLILRSALHGSIHNHSRLFRTGKRGGLLFKSPWRTPPPPPRPPCYPLFCTSRCRLLAAQICRANKHLVFCHKKITIRKPRLLLKEKWWITSQRSVT